MTWLTWALQLVGKLIGLLLPNTSDGTAAAASAAAEKAGQAREAARVNQAAAGVQGAIAQAEVDAPKTDEALDRRLRDGEF